MCTSIEKEQYLLLGKCSTRFYHNFQFTMVEFQKLTHFSRGILNVLQYCDVLVEEIQEMLAKLPDPLPTTRCHEKRGWLPSGFDAQCREIINKQVRAVLRKQMNIPEDCACHYLLYNEMTVDSCLFYNHLSRFTDPTDIPKHKRKRGIKLKLNKLRGRKRKRKSEPGVEEVRPSTSTTENE